MELRHLSTFRVVANTLNFTRAAAALDYAQSSVTAQIQALEEELGVPLFNRLGRQVVLTDAGQRLLAYAEKLLALEAEARTAVADGGKPTGTLTIGAPESVCTYRLPPILRQFHDWFPEVRLIFRPLFPADLHRSLSHGNVDAAFFLAEPVQSSSLVVETLVCEPLALVAAPDHSLAQLGRVASADLQNEAVLLTEKGCSYRGLFERRLAQDGVHPESSVEFSSIEAIKQCVAAGVGIAVLPVMVVAREIERGQLRTLPWEQDNFQVYTQLAWHKDRWLSPALAAFIEMSREVLKAVF